MLVPLIDRFGVFVSLYIYYLPKRHMMSDFLYSFINFRTHYSFYVTPVTPRLSPIFIQLQINYYKPKKSLQRHVCTWQDSGGNSREGQRMGGGEDENG